MSVQVNKDHIAVVRVKDLQHSSSQSILPGSYSLPNGDFLWLDGTGNVQKTPYDAKKCKPEDIPFTLLDSQRIINSSATTGLGPAKAKAQVEFFKNHPLVWNLNDGEEDNIYEFELEVFSDTVDKGTLDLDIFAKCFDVANAMSEADLQKVANYFMVANVSELSKAQLRIILLNPVDGFVRIGSPQIEDFNKLFVAEQEEAEKRESDMKIIVRTALGMGIISKEKGPFYMDTILLGTTEADVVTYFRRNEPLYEALEQKVSSHSSTPAAPAKTSAPKEREEYSDAERAYVDKELERLKAKSNGQKTETRFKHLNAALVEAGEKALSRQELKEKATA